MRIRRWPRSWIWRGKTIARDATELARDSLSAWLFARTTIWKQSASSLLHSDLSGFPAQHRLFAGDAPVVAGERAAFAERAVAGYDEGNGIPADRSADGARGFRVVNVAGDVGIGHRAPHRDLQQRLPHPHLEIGADHHHAQRLIRPPQFGVEDALRERNGAFMILDVSCVPPAPRHV